jgi:DNA invertase Pin-like site-specific DNA recombinase
VSATNKVRCAIYTRVSNEAGLDQDFNSLDAQFDAAQAYIRSQAHAGWVLVRTRYDDGGFSGGSTDRPALQRLLDDLKAGKVNVIVVYKVDRLTRSLADFAKLVADRMRLASRTRLPASAYSSIMLSFTPIQPPDMWNVG